MLSKKRPLLFPLLLVAYEIATYLSNDMYLPALPQMMRDLVINAAQAQLTLTAWFLGLACMPLIIGAIADRYGRRPVLLWGAFFYIVSTMVCALTHQMDVLLLARFVEGGMVATMMVAGYATIHELYEQKEAIRMLALMGSISVLAPALGPLFGAIVLYFTSWRGVFIVVAAWASIAVFFLYLLMPETLVLEKKQVVRASSLMGKYISLLGNRQFMLRMLVMGFNFCGFLSWITAGPLLVMTSYHHSAMVFGVIQAIVFGAYVVGNYCVNDLLERLGVWPLIRLGLGIIFCGSLLMLCAAHYFPSVLYVFLAAMIIYSFGSGLCFSPLNRMVIDASDEPMGVRVAMFTALFTCFAALGSIFSSLFFDGTITSLAWVVAIPGVISWLLGRGSVKQESLTVIQ